MAQNDLKTQDINPAPYNPRTMSEDEARGLHYSIESFGDISGITFNQRTQNLVSGHRRWEQLTKQASNGEKREISLKRVEVGEEADTVARYKILADGKATSFIMRVVDWDQRKEEAANVAANSHTISGKFDVELLSTLLDNMDSELKEILRMDQLGIDLGLGFKEGDWLGDDSIDPSDEKPKAWIKVKCQMDDKDHVEILLKRVFLEHGFQGIEVIC